MCMPLSSSQTFQIDHYRRYLIGCLSYSGDIQAILAQDETMVKIMGDFIDVTTVCGGKSEVWWLDIGYFIGYPNVHNRGEFA